MKQIFYALLGSALMLISCVEKMEEVESTQIGGIWAVVDEYNMSTSYYVFDKGYFTMYKSQYPYYVHDNYLWGISKEPNSYGKNKYKYSVEDGVLHYYDYFQNVHTDIMRKGNELTIGDMRCLLVKGVHKEYYSQIVLPETNKTKFNEDDEQIEWTYLINNPLYDYELEVKSFPQWCERLDVEDGKISFTVKAGTQTKVGQLVLSYPTAGDLAVEVKRGNVELLSDDTYACFRSSSAYGVLYFTVLNARDGVNPEVTTIAPWIKNLRVNGNSILFNVEQNNTGEPRASKITLSYDEVTLDFEVVQRSSSSYGFWLGEWKLTGANGVEQYVKITEMTRDYSYCMTGYGGLSDEFVAVLNWDRENWRWELKNQVVGNVNEGDGNDIEVWMCAGNSAGFITPEADTPICKCIQSTTLEYKLTSSGSAVDFITLATCRKGEWTQYPTSDFPTFPIKVTWAGN